MARKPDTRPEEPETTGHSWDGIQEYNNPLPRWWLWTFYGCIAFGLGYTVFYPAWPMLNGATPGILGYSTRAEVAAEIQAGLDANAVLDARLTSIPLAEVSADPELLQYATAGGASVFRTNCAQCHGAGAGGVQAAGFPNLLDDDWLWGGTLDDISLTVTHGIRWAADDDTRLSEMPPFGDYLTADEIESVAEHVLSLSGQAHDAAIAAPGVTLFADNCTSCHGEDGRGLRELGTPNLTDAIWLRGGTQGEIIAQITAPKNGIMPSWQSRLSDEQVRKVAVYVHSLGGGE